MAIEYKIPDRYCERCGKKMDAWPFIDHFNKNTGKPVKMNRYICPEIRDSREDMSFPEREGTLFGHHVYEELSNEI